MGNEGAALDCADESLQADKEIVEAAVLNDGNAMEYASDDLKNDKDFAFKLVMQSMWAICHVGKAMTEDKSLMTQAICSCDQCNPDLMKGYPHFTPLAYASSDLQADKELVLKAVWHNGYNYEYASDQLKAD